MQFCDVIYVRLYPGLISREQAEEHLSNCAAGTFLIRISDRIWGYALSYRTPDGFKHYLIDASDGRYRFFGGNQIVHATLDGLVEHHKVSSRV
jgi:SH2 domain-containing protein 4A